MNRNSAAQVRHGELLLSWPSSVPRGATLEEQRRHENSLHATLVFPGGKARASWQLATGPLSSPGELVWVRHMDLDGNAHGLELEYDDDRVMWQVPWVRGRMHGLARQFDASGTVLSRSPFVNGSGLDVWAGCGQVSEIRTFRRNERPGVERWGHPRLPWEESYYCRGRLAGVMRRWKGPALEPGYPKYFIDDAEVSHQTYLRARRTHPELVPDRRRDDARPRRLHPLLGKVWLRKELRVALLAPPDAEGC